MRTYTLKAEYAVVGVNPTTSTNTAVTLVVRRHVKKILGRDGVKRSCRRSSGKPSDERAPFVW
jgi:hypothetical protein